MFSLAEVGVSERRGVPQAGFQPQHCKTLITILRRCFHVGEELFFVEPILLRLQRGFTSRWVRKLQKSWLEGTSRGHTIHPHPPWHRTIASNRWGQQGPYLAKSWNPGWQSTLPLHTSVQHELPTQEGFSKSLVGTCQATVHDSCLSCHLPQGGRVWLLRPTIPSGNWDGFTCKLMSMKVEEP